MKFSQKWWGIVVLLFAFAATVSFFTAQNEDPSTVNVPGSSEVQAERIKVQSSSDESELKQPTLASNTDTTLADAEIDRRFNQLRRELLDDRAKTIDWWLAATAIFLTLLGVSAAILGYFGFKRLDRIENEARENLEKSEKHAKDAQRYLEQIRARRDEANSVLKGMTAEDARTNPDKASEAVESVQQNPESSPIERAVVAAFSLQQQGEIEKAVEQWRAIALVVEGSDNDLAARAWFSVGFLLGSTDDPDFNAEIDAYDKALRLKPDYAGAYNNRGIALSNLGQNKKAFADFDEALRLKPDYADAHNNRGVAKANLGHYKRALADLDEALRLKPDYAEAYYNRGNARKNLGQYEAALADFDEALRLKPDYAKAYINRGNTQTILGQYEAALADFDEALHLKPDFAKAYINRGVTKRELHRIDEAREDFKLALDLARSTGNANLMKLASGELKKLDKDDT